MLGDWTLLVGLNVQEQGGPPCPYQEPPPDCKVSGSGDRSTWVQILPGLLTSCRGVGECLTRSKPQFPHL